MAGAVALASEFFAAKGMEGGGSLVSRLTQPWINRSTPYWWNDPNTATDLWLLSWIGVEELSKAFQFNGLYTSGNIVKANFRPLSKGDTGIGIVNPSYGQSALYPSEMIPINNIFVPSIEEIMTMFRRGIIDYSAYFELMRLVTKGDDDMVRCYNDLLNDIPGPSDLIRFAVRETFDPQIIAQYGYLKEIPRAILPYMNAQGLGGSMGMPRPPGATYDNGQPANGEMKWFDAYWASHWELPSTGQGYEMLHRLYSNSRFGPSPDYVPGIAFSETDMSTLLKTADIPLYWRNRLIAMSYSPYSRVDIRRLYKSKIITEEEVYHNYRAQGYNDIKAKALTDYTKQQAEEQEKGKLKQKSADWVCKHYMLGALTRDEATTLMTQLGYTVFEVATWLSTCSVEMSAQEIRESINSIRQAVFSGVISTVEAGTALTEVGVKEPRLSQLLRIWSRKIMFEKRFASAGDIISFYKLGIISRDVAIARLQNLRYVSRDIISMMSRADYYIADDLLKRQQAAQKQQAKEVEKLQKAQEKVVNATIKEQLKQAEEMKQSLLIGATDKNLIGWFKKGIITREQIQARLHLKGMADQDIVRWIELNIPESIGVQSNAQTSQTTP